MRRIGFLLAVLAAAIAAWAGGLAARRGPEASARAPSGIVVLCIDTWRADRPLPSVERFGAGARRFDGALASSSWTGTSVATMLTGLDPWNHGFVEVAPGTRLAAAVPTLASRLAAAGWDTAAVTGGGWVGRGSGLVHDFASVAEDFDELDPADVVARWDARRRRDRPFFLFLHTYAAHDPYGDKSPAARRACADVPDAVARARRFEAAPPADLDLHAGGWLEDRLGDVCARDAVVRALGPRVADTLLARAGPWLEGAWRRAPDGEATVARLRAAYERGLEAVDARVGATLAALRDLPADTVVVVCSDHGEAFGEHGALQHGRHLHPELVRVPLWIRAPGRVEPGRTDAPCGLVDLAPTLLELADVPTQPLDGRSLLGLATEAGAGRVVASLVAAPAGGAGAPDVRRVAVRDRLHAWTATFDLAAGRVTEERWFHLLTDPGELRPLPVPPAARAPAFDAAVARVRAALSDRYALWVADGDGR